MKKTQGAFEIAGRHVTERSPYSKRNDVTARPPRRVSSFDVINGIGRCSASSY